MATDSSVDKRAMIERWNTVFRTLGAEPRRQIILSLMEASPDRKLSLPEAANPSYLLRDPEPLYHELVHTHLPMLADADLVEWDRDPLCVGRGERMEEAAIIFDALKAKSDEIPPQLAEGCQRLEEEQRQGDNR